MKKSIIFVVLLALTANLFAGGNLDVNLGLYSNYPIVPKIVVYDHPLMQNSAFYTSNDGWYVGYWCSKQFEKAEDHDKNGKKYGTNGTEDDYIVGYNFTWKKFDINTQLAYIDSYQFGPHKNDVIFPSTNITYTGFLSEKKTGLSLHYFFAPPFFLYDSWNDVQPFYKVGANYSGKLDNKWSYRAGLEFIDNNPGTFHSPSGTLVEKSLSIAYAPNSKWQISLTYSHLETASGNPNPKDAYHLWSLVCSRSIKIK